MISPLRHHHHRIFTLLFPDATDPPPPPPTHFASFRGRCPPPPRRLRRANKPSTLETRTHARQNGERLTWAGGGERGGGGGGTDSKRALRKHNICAIHVRVPFKRYLKKELSRAEPIPTPASDPRGTRDELNKCRGTPFKGKSNVHSSSALGQTTIVAHDLQRDCQSLATQEGIHTEHTYRKISTHAVATFSSHGEEIKQKGKAGKKEKHIKKGNKCTLVLNPC